MALPWGKRKRHQPRTPRLGRNNRYGQLQHGYFTRRLGRRTDHAVAVGLPAKVGRNPAAHGIVAAYSNSAWVQTKDASQGRVAKGTVTRDEPQSPSNIKTNQLSRARSRG